jgi:biopolymer transport protein TolQ
MTDLPIINYFLTASPVVEVVIAILILASIASWTIIFQRAIVMGRARRATRRFEKRFQSATSLQALFDEMAPKADSQEGVAAIYYAGYNEYMHLLENPNLSDEAIWQGVERAMRSAYSYEEEDLETHLSFLGTIGSTSPYIGLFGTVWGIMMAFHALGAAQQVTISMVAPGISEALIATAMGLFAAIPAVVFYNRYVNRSNRLLNRFDAFQDDVMSAMQRVSHTKNGA